MYILKIEVKKQPLKKNKKQPRLVFTKDATGKVRVYER